MKKSLIICLGLLFFGYQLYAQPDHQTYNNYTGDWSDPGSWTIGDGNMGAGDLTYIYGYITVDGDLNLNTGRDLEVFDTLVVTGDITMNCGFFGPHTDLTIHAGGLLIVVGDMIGDHCFVTVDGDMIVMGEFELLNSVFLPLDVDGHAYIFDDDFQISPDPWPPDPTYWDDMLEEEDDIPYPLDEFFEQVSCTATDTEDPTVASCPSNINTNVGAGTCTAVITYTTPTFDDNCDGTGLNGTLTSGFTSGSSFPLGTTTVTYEYTDAAGNGPVSCSFDVIVADNIDPSISCIGNQTAVADAGLCTYTHSGTAWDATATDNCSVASITYNLTGVTSGSGSSLDGVTFNLGETTVTWTATDGSSNTDICSYTVTITDDQDPSISCVSNQATVADAGVCTYTHSGTAWDATATDNCSVASITYNLT